MEVQCHVTAVAVVDVGCHHHVTRPTQTATAELFAYSATLAGKHRSADLLPTLPR